MNGSGVIHQASKSAKSTNQPFHSPYSIIHYMNRETRLRSTCSQLPPHTTGGLCRASDRCRAGRDRRFGGEGGEKGDGSLRGSPGDSHYRGCHRCRKVIFCLAPSTLFMASVSQRVLFPLPAWRVVFCRAGLCHVVLFCYCFVPCRSHSGMRRFFFFFMKRYSRFYVRHFHVPSSCFFFFVVLLLSRMLSVRFISFRVTCFPCVESCCVPVLCAAHVL